MRGLLGRAAGPAGCRRRRSAAPAAASSVRSPSARKITVDVAAGLQHRGGGAEPGIEAAGAEHMGAGARRRRRARAAGRVVEGRVDEHVSARSRPTPARSRSASGAAMSAATMRDAAGEGGIRRARPAPRARRRSASGSRSTSTTCAPLQRAAAQNPATPTPAPRSTTVPAMRGIERGGEEHGLEAGAVMAGGGLHGLDPAAEEGVDGDVPALGRTRRAASRASALPFGVRVRRRCRHRSAAAGASSTGRSATSTRRGRMPSEPSMTLMFWSATRCSMPASRSSASTKEISDDVVGPEQFFHRAPPGSASDATALEADNHGGSRPTRHNRGLPVAVPRRRLVPCAATALPIVAPKAKSDSGSMSRGRRRSARGKQAEGAAPASRRWSRLTRDAMERVNELILDARRLRRRA